MGSCYTKYFQKNALEVIYSHKKFYISKKKMYYIKTMDDFKLDKNTKLRKAIENEINKKTHVEKIIKSTPSIKLKEGALNFINFMKEQNIHNREYFTKQIIDDLNDEYVIFQDIDIISEILIDIKKIIIQNLNNYILLIIYYICNNLNEKINKAKQSKTF